MVGREVELARLQNVFEKAWRGERQVVFVTGEAGIGKTTLIDAFLARIRERPDVRIASGQCVEQYGPGEAYLPLLEATTRLCRGPGGERYIEVLHRYAPSWLVQLPSLLTPEDRHFLQGRVQGANRERMLREMAEAAEQFTVRRGVVLVLEDLHWSDVSTLEWLSYTARRREPAKLMILGTYRPVDVLASGHPLRGVVQELQARRQCHEIRLEPLAEETIAEYLSARFAGGAAHVSLPQDLAPLLARRTGGNPLFVVNTVDYFVRQGAVTEEAGQWTLQTDKISEVGEGVPDTLRQLIERQVERLSEAEQRLLAVASVAGVEFAAAEAAAGLQGDIATLEALCERLARTGQLLRAEGVAEWPDGTLSGRYSFLHALYHEVVYARVAAVPRMQWHRRIAERKEAAYGERAREIAAELAAHFVEGRDYHKAVQYLQHAGKNAVGRSAHQEAVAHFTRGLDLLATLPDTPERRQRELALQVALGVPLVRTKGYAAPEVAHAYGRARELCQQIGEQPELFTVFVGLCSFYLVQAELQTARKLAEQCLRLAQHAQDPALLVEAHFILGVTLFYGGELTAAQAMFERGRAFYDPQTHGSLTAIYGQDPGVGCRSYASLASWLLGYPDQALGESHDALSLVRELSHPFSLGATLQTATWLRQYRQEGLAVQAHAEEEIALSKEDGFALWLAVGVIQQGWALSEQGDGEKGLARMREGVTALKATGANLSQPYHLALLAQTHGKSGHLHEGLALLEQALAAADKTDERYYEAELYRLKGELTLQKLSVASSQLSAPNPHPPVPNPRAEAEECFLKAIEVARRQQAKSLELRAAMSLARLWQCQGKTAEARKRLEEIYSWFSEGFDTKDLQDAAALLGKLGVSVQRRAEPQKSNVESQKSTITDTQLLASDLFFSSFQPPASNSQPPSPTPAESYPSTSDTGHQMPDTVFRPEGEYWTVSFAGTTCRLKDALGLHYIAHLLHNPHQEVHVITLLTMSTDPSEAPAEVQPFQDPTLPLAHSEGGCDAGEILDPQARASYKQRLSELREELAEAQQFHDLGRSEQLAAEIDFLAHELTSAVSLAGQARRVGSPAERARVNITRAIKLALRKIGEHHPALGQHLATTVKTGTYCSYTPDVRMPVAWQE
jgi:predicted ATPase/type II secretory pathway predicted ATPase ExeA